MIAPFESPPSVLKTKESQPGFYQLIWRWHFYAALFVLPFLIVFAVTGSIYLFKPQLESWIYQDLYRVTPGKHQISPDAQVQIALDRFPLAKAEAYIAPHHANNSAQVRILAASQHEMTVAVNPYTGTILGAIDDQKRPLQIIRELHGKLLAGRPGQMIQELAASWAMILILTGLYLWWPRQGSKTQQSSKIMGTYLPRLNGTGRIFWRDLHAITGFWISGLLLFLILTGLPWSVVSGDLIHRLASSIGKGSPDTGLGWNGGGSQTVKSQRIAEDWATTHAKQIAGTAFSKVSANKPPLTLVKVLKIAQKLPELRGHFEIRMPIDQRGVFTILTDHEQDPTKIAYIHLDQYSGKVIKNVRWKDFGPLAQAISLGVVLHEGQYFGLPNQLLGLVACLGLLLMNVSGIVMWWHRRPTGTFGTPSQTSGFQLSPLVLAIVFILAILMPLFGISLIAILSAEWLFRKVLILLKKECA